MLTAVLLTVISQFTLCVYTLATLKSIPDQTKIAYMTRENL